MFTRSKPQPALPQPPEELAKRAPPPHIEELSYAELKAFYEQVAAILTRRETQERDDFKRDCIERMSELGLTLDDLKPEKPKKERKPRETKPKYRNPETGEEWSGRGKPPGWMQDLLDQGRQLDEFAIGTTEDAQT